MAVDSSLFFLFLWPEISADTRIIGIMNTITERGKARHPTDISSGVLSYLVDGGLKSNAFYRNASPVGSSYRAKEQEEGEGVNPCGSLSPPAMLPGWNLLKILSDGPAIYPIYLVIIDNEFPADLLFLPLNKIKAIYRRKNPRGPGSWGFLF